jgi:hypothetical protein
MGTKNDFYYRLKFHITIHPLFVKRKRLLVNFNAN